MAASKAELWAQLSNAIKLVDQTWKYCATNTPNFKTLQDTLEQLYEGNHITTTSAAINSYRNALNTICGLSSPLNAIILELAKQGYNSINTAIAAALDDIIKGMDTATETVRYRNWTHGAVAATGGNTGDGTVYRCVTDQYGEEIEVGAVDAGVVKVEITRDKNNGATSGQEAALLFGSGVTPIDNIDVGTAPAGTQVVAATRSEDGKLTNSSFETNAGTGGTDITFTGWALDSSTNFDKDEANYFRYAAGSNDSGTSLEFLLNGVATQYLYKDAGLSIDLTKPVFLIVRYSRKTSCDGTFTIRLGSQTAAVDVSTKTNDLWYDLVIGVDDAKGWYDVWKEDSVTFGARVQLSLASRTTGTLLVDCVILAQPVIYDGKYYLLTSGETDYLLKDSFTFTDSVVNTGRNQFTIARLYNKSLPHATAAETYADA